MKTKRKSPKIDLATKRLLRFYKQTTKNLLKIVSSPPPCNHENCGTSHKDGVKSVVCCSCNKLLWCVRVPDNDELDPARGC